jgi:hypothetical protein
MIQDPQDDLLVIGVPTGPPSAPVPQPGFRGEWRPPAIDGPDRRDVLSAGGEPLLDEGSGEVDQQGLAVGVMITSQIGSVMKVCPANP